MAGNLWMIVNILVNRPHAQRTYVPCEIGLKAGARYVGPSLIEFSGWLRAERALPNEIEQNEVVNGLMF